MITKNDCILLLSLMPQNETSTKILNLALKSSSIDLRVVKYINDYRQLDANTFYEKIRKAYNSSKKSMLYKNIVTCDESDCSDHVLTTLAALNLQILLFAKNVENEKMFLSHMRFEEITEALLNYSRTFDLIPCIRVLQIIKADLKAFEFMNREM